MGNYLKFEDLSSPISAFNFGNQELRNLSSLVLGSNSAGGYPLDFKNGQLITNFTGYEKGVLNIENGGAYTGNENKYLAIDFTYEINYGKPTARIGCQLTDSGTLLALGTSTTYASGITNIDMLAGYFATETTNGIKVKDSILFSTNNVGSIGTSSVSVANIYAVNALNVTSDIREKIVNEKLNLKKDFSFEFLEKMVKNCIISWKWKPDLIPERKRNRKNKETGLNEIYIEPEKIVNHTRSHIGLNLNELYKLMIEFNMSTKDYAFLSINDTYEVKNLDEKGNEIIEIKSSFDEKGDPILDAQGYPLGKLTYKPQELQSLLFIYTLELHKRDIDKNKRLEAQEKRLDELEKQMKLLLK